MKKLFLLFALAVVAMSCGAHCPSNEIWYTTTDGKKLFPNNTEPAAFGTLLVSNIYKDGQGVLTFDDDITLIGGGVFSDCTTLATITIPESVTEIGDFAFEGCSSLTSVTIPDSVTTIGEGAFSGCSSLTSVTIPDSITEIGDYAFCNCDNIASVKHPDSVTTVEREVFAKQPIRCKYADFLHLPHDLRGHFDFDEAVEEAKSVDMPILVYVVGHACNNCREMENVVWSDSKVLPMLQNDFVICALYVDDMTKVEGGKRLGSINSQLAHERWGINAQPAYILLSPDGKNVLAGPRGYDLDIDAFAEFLEQALASECIRQTKCSAKTVADKTFGKVVNENDSDLVEWAVSAEDNGDGTFAVTFEATIADGYRTYSMNDYFSGPMIDFDNAEIVGGVVEPLPAKEIIDDFGDTALVYYNKATYIFAIKANYGQRVRGFISATIADNEANSMRCCSADFEITIPRRVR